MNCPCADRTAENQFGVVLWRAEDDGEWCENQAVSFTLLNGKVRDDGWCEDCITKVCPWCRHD